MKKTREEHNPYFASKVFLIKTMAVEKNEEKKERKEKKRKKNVTLS